MNRRAFLVTAGGIASAGCTGPPAGRVFEADDGPDRAAYGVDEPLDASTPDVLDADAIRIGPDRVEPAVPARTIVVSRLPSDRGPDEVRYTCGFDHPGSPDAPPILRIAATNEGSSALEPSFGPTPPFSGYVGTADDGDGPTELVLAPVAPETSGSFDGDCWRVDRRTLPPADGASTIELEPGEAVTGRYALFVPRHESTCLEPGRYGFDDPVTGRTLRLTVWDTERIAPGRSRFDGSEVPPVPGAEAVDWFHEANRDARVYLEPATETATRPRAELAFELANYTSERVSVDPDTRNVYRFDDGGWASIGDPFPPRPTRLLEPGETSRSAFEIDTEPPKADSGDEPADPTLTGLAPGVYAYEHGTVARGLGTLAVDWRPAALFEVRGADAAGESDADRGGAARIRGFVAP